MGVFEGVESIGKDVFKVLMSNEADVELGLRDGVEGCKLVETSC